MNVRRPKVIDAAGHDHEHVDTEAVGITHLCATGGTPTIAASSLSLGSTVALTAGSTDAAGEVVITTGLVSLAIGQVVTVTFATPYANRPWVNLTPATTNAVAVAAASGLANGTGFTVTTAVSLAVSSTYRLGYQTIGTAGG